jgi:hypothetical protein
VKFIETVGSSKCFFEVEFALLSICSAGYSATRLIFCFHLFKIEFLAATAPVFS